MEGAIKHMSNVLDFENKRAYFKQEIVKLKRGNQYYDQIQLSIRRKDIFMDTYMQMKDLPPEHLKNRLHVSFIGEGG